MFLVRPTSVVEAKKSRYLMRHLGMHLFLDCFPEKYTQNEAATSTANMLKRAPDRKGGGGRKRGLKATSADFSADETGNGNGLIVLEDEE